MPTPSELREAVGDLATLARSDLQQLWRDLKTADAAREALRDVLPTLIRVYGAAAATVAADWYDDFREEQEVPGRFRALPAEPETAAGEPLARWAVTPLFRDEPDWRRALVLADGGVQLRIAGAARQTIAQSSVADPRATGWQRVGAGNCPFCALLIGRGAVYTQATVSFAAHDHCKCGATPAFSGRPLPVNPYTPSSRDVSDADRARVREYLAAHNAG